MASAYCDRHGWIADFRGLHQVGKQHRTWRVAACHLRPGHEPEDAKSYATECARLCRLCEMAKPATANIDRAEQMGAITPEQAQSLRAGDRPLTAAELRPRKVATILDAARMHPSSKRETINDIARHERDVLAFCAWAKTDRLRDLTIDLTTDWIAHLESQGWAYDSRRHALLWLRRASRMAAAMGMADPLSKLILDRRASRPVVRAWTADELGQLLRGARALPDRRLEAVVLLGGFCGLRTSEIQRLQVQDWSGGVLAVAARESKNKASRRHLPMPPTVAVVLDALADGHPPGHHLIRTSSNRAAGKASDGGTGAGFGYHAFARWFALSVWGEAPGKESRTGAAPSVPRLPFKCLRKSFMSWVLRAGAPSDLAERYAGHTISGMSAVTERSYFADLQAIELRPVAKIIESSLRPYGNSLRSRKSLARKA